MRHALRITASIAVKLSVEESRQISVVACTPARPLAIVFGGRRTHCVVAPPFVNVIVPKAVVERAVRHAAESEKKHVLFRKTKTTQ